MSSSLVEETKRVLLAPRRRELQGLAKRLGIKANAKNTVLIEKLEEYVKNAPPLTDARVKALVESEEACENKELELIQSSDQWPRISLVTALDEEAEKRVLSPMDIDPDPTTMDRRALFLASRLHNSATRVEQIRAQKRAKTFGLDKSRPNAQSKKSKPLNIRSHNLLPSLEKSDSPQ